MMSESSSNNNTIQQRELEELNNLIAHKNQTGDAQKKAEYLVKKYPDNANVKQTLASVYLNKGRIEESKEILESIVNNNEDNEYTHYFLLLIFAKNKNLKGFIKSFFQAVRINKNFFEIYKIFFTHLNTERLKDLKREDLDLIQCNESKNIINYALKNNFIPLSDTKAIIQEIYLEDLSFFRKDLYEGKLINFLSNYFYGENKNLVSYLLENTNVTKYTLEKDLILIRKTILENLNDLQKIEDSSNLTDLISIIFSQSHLNGHIWFLDKETKIKLEELVKTNIKKIKDREKVNHLEILIIGTFVNLNEFPEFKNFINKNLKKEEQRIYKKISVFFNKLNEDKNLIKKIKSLYFIKDKTSKELEKHYDKNSSLPWDYVNTDGDIDFIDYLKINLHPTDLLGKRKFTDYPKILYIGAGSGRDPLKLNTLKNAEIDIIDLSIENLVYAKKKAIEHNIKNINLYHLDLLNIDHLDKKYDVIYADKILNQIEDFEYGFKLIVNKLNPGGFIKIILKSPFSYESDEIIRKKINLIKEEIDDCKNSIQLLRKNITESNDQDLKRFILTKTFYDKSSLNKFLNPKYKTIKNIKEIKSLLNINKLEFIGWSDFIINRTIREAVINLYASEYKDDYLKKNLDNWHTFEKENPIIFSDMYKFWVKKNNH